MTAYSLLRVDDLSVAVSRRQGSRSACLTVERDGSLTIAAPESVDVAELESFVRAKKHWVYRKLAEKEGLTQYRPVKRIVNGEGFAYLSRNYRLQLSRKSGFGVKLASGRLLLARDARELADAELVRWYQERGAHWLDRYVGQWAERLGVEPMSIDVRPLGYRWGSATPTGRIYINWVTMQLRPTLVEYVLVHELAHLKVPSHAPEFWSVVRRALPGADDLRRELAVAGAELWFGEVE